MRLLFLCALIALSSLALVDMSHRVGALLFKPLPEAEQLQVSEVGLRELRSMQYCTPQRRGGEICRWGIEVRTLDDRSLRLNLAPMDDRYALLQSGDRLRIGVYRETIYTLERLTAGHSVVGLESRAVLLDETGFSQWRQRWQVQQIGWIVGELLIVSLVFLIGQRLPQLSLGGSVILILLLSIFGHVLWGKPKPSALPEQAELVNMPVGQFLLAERLVCPQHWAFEAKCEPQQVLVDESGKLWPLAYAEVMVLPAQRGDSLLLGIYAGKIYRITHAPREPGTPTDCAYQQNPMARRAQVIWMCDDDRRLLERSRNPLSSAQQQFDELAEKTRRTKVILDFSASEWAYREARRDYERHWAMLFLAPLLITLLAICKPIIDVLLKRWKGRKSGDLS